MTDRRRRSEHLHLARLPVEVIRSCPHYRLVPKDVDWNLEFRLRVSLLADEDESIRASLLAMCEQDILFWVNLFVFTYDQRVFPTLLPFTTFTFQDIGLLKILDAIRTGYDLLIKKSRDEGASWLLCVAFVYDFMFRSDRSFLLGSRKEELVDKRGNPKSLFWKIDRILENLPAWMQPVTTRTALSIVNEENGSVIVGESTNPDFGRGDRHTAVGLDEFASVPEAYAVLEATRDTAPCRIFNSTPKGAGNAFAELHDKGDVAVVEFRWEDDPRKNPGMYRSSGGRLEIVDEGYSFPADYKFVLDGLVRSPWFDNECGRAVHFSEIRQEVMRDFLASDAPFFEAATLEEVVGRDCRPPLRVGVLDYEDDGAQPLRFREDPTGPFRLWFIPGLDGSPPRQHRYVIGVDVAEGTGATMSVVSVWDRVTREKVAQWMGSQVMPHELAPMVAAVGRWFCGSDKGGEAYLVWEAPGPGRTFGRVLLERDYKHIYYHKRKEKEIAPAPSLVPGFWPTKDNKRDLLGNYRRLLAQALVINRDEDAVRECRQIKFFPDGTIDHARSRNKLDPSAARENHADIVMADALACMLLGDVTKPEPDDPEAPTGSFLHRRQERRQELQRAAREAEW